MPLNRFDLNLLIALDALLRDKNVTRAGERVYLSQSAMSGALQRLRDYFGDELLVRTGREFELTPRASSLVKPVREILLRIQATLEVEPTFDPFTAKRVFSIVMSDYCFVAFMRAVIPRLQQEAPGVTCRIGGIDAASFKRLEGGDIDFCLIPENVALVSEAESSTLRRTKLFTDDWVCAVSNDHPTVEDSLSFEQYLALPHAFTDYGLGTSTVEDAQLRHDGLKINIALSYGGFSALPFVLPGTLMVATLQRRLARVLASSLPIKLFPAPLPLPSIQESLFWHQRHDFEPGHMWLRSLFLNVAREF